MIFTVLNTTLNNLAAKSASLQLAMNVTIVQVTVFKATAIIIHTRVGKPVVLNQIISIEPFLLRETVDQLSCFYIKNFDTMLMRTVNANLPQRIELKYKRNANFMTK